MLGQVCKTAGRHSNLQMSPKKILGGRLDNYNQQQPATANTTVLNGTGRTAYVIAEHRIPYVKVGRLIRFDPAEIAAWLDRGRHPTGPVS